MMTKKITLTALFLLVVSVAFTGCQPSITGQATSDLSCSMGVEIDLLEFEGERQACAEDTFLEISVENKGQKLKGLKVLAEAEKQSFDYETTSTVAQGSTARIIVPYNKQNTGKVLSTEILPVIGNSDSKQTCAGQSIVVKPLKPCPE